VDSRNGPSCYGWLDLIRSWRPVDVDLETQLARLACAKLVKAFLVGLGNPGRILLKLGVPRALVAVDRQADVSSPAEIAPPASSRIHHESSVRLVASNRDGVAATRLSAGDGQEHEFPAEQPVQRRSKQRTDNWVDDTEHRLRRLARLHGRSFRGTHRKEASSSFF
jgi:hypothetical protein